MENFRALPIYNIVVNLDDDDAYMSVISLVDYPAVERNFELFDKQKPLSFQIQNEEKHEIFGPAILADTPIYRRSAELGEYYCNFTRENIENIVLKYSKNQLWNSVSLQHSGENISGAICIEFFIKDSAKGLVPTNYEDCPDGSLFATFKITDEKLWDEIKNSGELNGYSIEILGELELTQNVVEEKEDSIEDDEFQELLDLLAELGLDVLFEDEKKKFANEDIKKVLEDAVENETGVEIKVDGKTIKGYPYTLYDREGSSNVALWDGKTWHSVNLKDIESLQTTTAKATSDIWTKAMTDPSYDWLQKTLDQANNVNPANNPKSEIEDCIVNGRWCIINYNDDKPNPKTGARQCLVMERGWTCAGNAAIRVWEQFGDSRHPEDISGWRTMLRHRITSFRVIDYLEPATVAPEGFRPLGAGEDRDGFVCDLRSPLK